MPRTSSIRIGKVISLVLLTILVTTLYKWQNRLLRNLSKEVVRDETTRELVIPKKACDDESESFDATIIINTSLIKTHPSLLMFNATFDSLRHLRGLPPKTPIIITVDGLMSEESQAFSYEPNDTLENKKRLQQYVSNLRLRFKEDKHVTILTNYDNGLLTVNLQMAMDYVDTKYVIVVQHDLRFILDVDYTALIQSMEDNPETVKIVRFSSFKNMRYKNWLEIEDKETREFCVHPFYDEKNNITYIPNTFSDQNHITTMEYYVWMMDKLGPSKRFMESAMMQSIDTDKDPKSCRTFGQWLYGPMSSGPWINHLDGQNAEGIAET